MENKSPEVTSNKAVKSSFFAPWDNVKRQLPAPLRVSIEVVEFVLTLLILLIVIRQGIFERRYIPSESMLPNLQIGDQLIIEKISKNLHLIGKGPGLQRGDVVVFYPPAEANYGQDLKHDFANEFVRLTGLSSDITIGKIPVFFFLPKAEDAYIKRVIGLAGDKIQIRANDGVYINGKKLHENYTLEKPEYSISLMSDIVLLKDSMKSEEQIVVPDGHYFCLGDNRNNSNDGHIWGFVKQDRVIGRAYSIIWRDLGQLKPYLD